MMARSILLAFAISALGIPAAAASDPLGFAGPFRQVGWVQCSLPIRQQMQGACDPAPVDASLPTAVLVRAHLARAVTLVSLMRMEEARKAADAAVQADPQNVDALTFRGRLALHMMQGDVAERDFNAGLMLDPANPALLASRAHILLGKGEKKAALRDISAAVEAKPDDADVLWIKARVYIALGQFARAEEALEHALQIDPDDRRARLFKAQVRLRAGNFDGAIEDATQLHARVPGDPSPLEVRAIALMARSRHAEAVADLGEIVGPPGEPTSAVTVSHYRELLLQRAIMLAQLGRSDETRKDIGTLISAGGKQAVLRLQVYLRQHGFPNVPLDGERASILDDAIEACFVNSVCAQGLKL